MEVQQKKKVLKKPLMTSTEAYGSFFNPKTIVNNLNLFASKTKNDDEVPIINHIPRKTSQAMPNTESNRNNNLSKANNFNFEDDDGKLELGSLSSLEKDEHAHHKNDDDKDYNDDHSYSKEQFSDGENMASSTPSKKNRKDSSTDNEDINEMDVRFIRDYLFE